MIKKNPLYIILSVVTISFALLGLLLLIVKYEKSIEDEIFKATTADVLQITANQAKHINHLLQNSSDYVATIQKDEQFQKTLEEHLEILITQNIKYAYIVYKDKKDIFRFLADGAPADEKAMLNQKLDIESPLWFEVYQTKKPTTINHTVLQKLYLTHLVPILNPHNDVTMLLVIDFSIGAVAKVNEILQMIKVGLYFILSVIFIFLVVFTYQVIKYKNMKKSSFTDKLTNIYNRNYLYEIQDELNLDDFVLAALDIDHFKEVNDTHGHDAGDRILKEMGHILLHTIRIEDDIVIRYGGEEFVVMIKTKRGDTKVALTVIERIHKNIKEHKMFIDDKDFIYITVSIGVNTTPSKSKNFLEAFKIADNALYEAKNSGRDKIVVYEEKISPP